MGGGAKVGSSSARAGSKVAACAAGVRARCNSNETPRGVAFRVRLIECHGWVAGDVSDDEKWRAL